MFIPCGVNHRVLLASFIFENNLFIELKILPISLARFKNVKRIINLALNGPSYYPFASILTVVKEVGQ